MFMKVRTVSKHDGPLQKQIFCSMHSMHLTGMDALWHLSCDSLTSHDTLPNPQDPLNVSNC